MLTDKVLWWVVIGAGAALQVAGILNPQRFITFTELVKPFVPVWFRAGIIGFLFYHFCVENR